MQDEESRGESEDHDKLNIQKIIDISGSDESEIIHAILDDAQNEVSEEAMQAYEIRKRDSILSDQVELKKFRYAIKYES